MGKERRKSKRFKTPLKLEYRALAQNPIYDRVKLGDISKGGFSFLAKESVKQGTQLEVKMNVPGDNLPVFATGTVAWARGINAGVKLTKIKDIDQAKILEFIYKSWLKEKTNSG
jgi:c-di-GMP-binding flagellar brake protein YcgR